MKKLSILGVTGSIGAQTLEVIRKSKDLFNLIGITANKSVKEIKEIIREFNPKYVGMMNEECAKDIEEYCKEQKLNTTVYSGIEGLIKIATLDEIDIVVTSVVGMIGLEPTMAAIKAKKDIALANKETLVVAGELVMKAAKENDVKILPVDSEHSAIYQALRGNEYDSINKIILTASGGPFRGRTIDNWSMGKKISVDSATLMNKGLEVIEAHYLFDCSYENIQVVVHPQSIIHSMVEYKDASIIAQLGSADMKLPIQYALNYTERKEKIAKSIDFYEIATLNFEKPDRETFKCLDLAYQVGEKGGLWPTILNSANEVAVDLFLNRKIGFLDIVKIIENSLEEFKSETSNELTLENILSLDKKVRKNIYNKYN